LASFAVLALVGCTGRSEPKLTDRVVRNGQVKAVFDDWYNGGLTERHSCAAVVVASSRIPEDGAVYSTLAADLARYAAHVCTHDRDLAAIKPGMANSDVAALAGAPLMPVTGRCWFYPTRTSHRADGQEVCFYDGRVTGRPFRYHWAAAG
jgi:hypothetical protein